MKNKVKSKSKTVKKTQKQEVKRPAHKKPRPKKYVEAKIPTLPPVPTTTVEIKKEAPKSVTVEMPNGHTEESLTKVVLSAAEQLKIIADELRANEADDAWAAREANSPSYLKSVYKEPGVGLIKRHLSTNKDMVRYSQEHMEQSELHAKMLNEEIPAKPEWGAKRKYVVIKEGWRKGKVQVVLPDYIPEVSAPAKKTLLGWFLGLFE